jgi:hypothetical protein
MTMALEEVGGSASCPGHSLPPGKTRYAMYRRLGGPQNRSEHVRKISSPPGFDPRIIQPIASRYTMPPGPREHIEKLYKCDKHGMIHMLYKLTDTHLSPVTQCAMKVSLAAEVMSHMVAAEICRGVQHRVPAHSCVC